jgi:hypothetical protein
MSASVPGEVHGLNDEAKVKSNSPAQCANACTMSVCNLPKMSRAERTPMRRCLIFVTPHPLLGFAGLC